MDIKEDTIMDNSSNNHRWDEEFESETDRF